MQQTAEVTADEPLLPYSFAQFLANPCGLMSSNSVASQLARNKIIKSAEMRLAAAAAASQSGDELLLWKEVHQFLDPIRPRYQINRDSLSEKQLKAVIDEFLLVLQEVKYRIKLVQHQKVCVLYVIIIYNQNKKLIASFCYTPKKKYLHQCENIKLASLPINSLKQLVNQKVIVTE